MLSNYNCAGNKPYGVSIIASNPLEYSWISSYPSIETIYESDPEIIMVPFWDEIFESKKITLKVVVNDDKGTELFKSEPKNVTLRSNTVFTLPIELDRGDKAKLMPGIFKARLYVDDQLAAERKLQYVAKSILNKNVQRAVILPFNDTTIESNLVQDAISVALNTTSHAIYSEVKRIIPDAIPHYIVEEKIGKLLKPNCFDEPECTDLIKNTYGYYTHNRN